ncbi:MAG: hypothetical protein ACSLEZ_11560 [Thiobacillus sp.]
MRWRKHGLIWRPDGSKPWARTHATCPTPLVLDDGTLRVYLQSRDAQNVGRIGFVDLDPADPRKVLREAAAPVLDIGDPGAFDDNGVFQTSIVRQADGRLFMYYVGFELCHHIRYRLLTGLAISEDGGASFQRYSTVPILERSSAEPHIRGGPFVLRESERFRMWYVAGGSWEEIAGKSMPIYDIRYLESSDGIHWPDTGRVVLPVTGANEHGFGRPYVLHDGAGYRMHYSIRRRLPAAYRLGYAISPDGLAWDRRDDEIGIDVSAQGWDSESIDYGAEIQVGGKTWLLYNGNDFGGTGVGLAERLDG